MQHLYINLQYLLPGCHKLCAAYVFTKMTDDLDDLDI